MLLRDTKNTPYAVTTALCLFCLIPPLFAASAHNRHQMAGDWQDEGRRLPLVGSVIISAGGL